MTRYSLRNIKSKKVKEINFEDGTPSTGGYKNEFNWLITGMLALINLRHGQLNGEIVEYKATVKIAATKNKIYGTRHMKVFNLANQGQVIDQGLVADPSDQYNDGVVHTGTVTGKIYLISYAEMTILGFKHNFSVSEDGDEVTITVYNPCGAEHLNLNFTLFTEFPITREMITDVITFNQNENYVLEVIIKILSRLIK